MAPPRRIAALPGMAAQAEGALESAAPGHRFLLYLRNWQEGSFEPYKVVRHDRNLQGAQKRDEIKRLEAERNAVLRETCPLPAASVAQLAALRQRQRTMMAACGEAGCTLSAVATAPFATGLGLEHPTENGFAFLTPYGLPYLAGSGIKGVVRRAAEQLALENDTQADSGWTWGDIWWLFGFEGAAGALWSQAASNQRAAFEHDLDALAGRLDVQALAARLGAKAGGRAASAAAPPDARAFLQRLLRDRAYRESVHLRGALDFWDAFGAPAGNRLTVEIMTPHHAGYLQRGGVPHEAEQPVPVTFLALPAGSRFDFHVRCAPSRLPDGLRASGRWRGLLEAAFAHAFDVLGFGAKTAVGYGAMQRADGSPAVPRPGAPMAEVAAGQASGQAAAQPLPATGEQTWPAAQLQYVPGTGEIKAFLQGRATAGLRGEAAQALLQALGAERAARLKSKKELKAVDVRVREQGNSLQLIGLAQPPQDS